MKEKTYKTMTLHGQIVRVEMCPPARAHKPALMNDIYLSSSPYCPSLSQLDKDYSETVVLHEKTS